MILSVDHSITPGNFETYISGIRQPIASLPKIDNYIQSLRTNLLQSIVEKNKEVKSQTTKDSKGNVVSEQNKVTSNANGGKEVTQVQSCIPSNSYNRFVNITPTNTKSTFKEALSTIKSQMTASGVSDDGKLKYCVFAALFLESSTTTGLEAYENNFAGIDLSQSWGTSSRYFNGNEQFFCLKSDTTTLPYAVFDDLSNNVRLLIERWKDRMGNVPNNSAKEITKFWILNFGANQNQSNVYTSMDPTKLSNIESKVQKSIDNVNSLELITP
jgi:hypothetical protein